MFSDFQSLHGQPSKQKENVFICFCVFCALERQQNSTIAPNTNRHGEYGEKINTADWKEARFVDFMQSLGINLFILMSFVNRKTFPVLFENISVLFCFPEVFRMKSFDEIC